MHAYSFLIDADETENEDPIHWMHPLWYLPYILPDGYGYG